MKYTFDGFAPAETVLCLPILDQNYKSPEIYSKNDLSIKQHYGLNENYYQIK